MKRINYETGLWSERDGSLLTWGKGDKKQAARFRADDKIDDVRLPPVIAAIRKAGYTPDMFCSVGCETVARILIPEIEACIAHAKDKIAADQAKDKTVFDAAVADGTAFRTAEIADQYDAELHWAHKGKPDNGYADWVIFGFAGSPRVTVEREAIRKVIGDRKSCGAFPGCSNTAWEITADEWDQIINISVDIKNRKVEAHKRFEAEETTDIQNKIDTGYCFYCETWCHGDCGHYNNNPEIKFRRDLQQAQREAAYGINEEA
ncbi:MAG TPA: hypothetical protein DCR95_09245 [Desulfobacter sp.]|nr:hypothetical protein [Desulfobacter sp.]